MSYAEPEQSNEIYNVDIEIRDIKKRWHHKMVSKNFPRRVRDFGLKHSAKVIKIITPAKLNIRTPIEEVMRETPDI